MTNDQEQVPGLATASRSGHDETSRETVSAAALRVERALSVARLVFFGAILVRFLLLGTTRWPSGIATVSPLVFGLAFSVVVLARFRTPPRGEALWLASVSVDALACFGALLPNALWPVPGHVGVLNMPDTAGILLATAAAGLRLSPRAAVWAGLLNAGALLGLVAIDAKVSGDRFATGAGPVSMYLVWVLGSTLVAVILAVTIRRLVLRSAEAATRTARAEQGLWAVLAEHHDLRSMLGAVSIRSELLAEAHGESNHGPSAGHLQSQAEEVRDGLARIRRVVEDVRSHALGDLAQTRPLEPVAVAEAAGRIADQVRLRFPSDPQHEEGAHDSNHDPDRMRNIGSVVRLRGRFPQHGHGGGRRLRRGGRGGDRRVASLKSGGRVSCRG